MRDLDMSDVLADAQDMLDQHLMQMYNKLDQHTDAELEEFRYWARIRAHAEGDIYELRAIDDILLRRTATTLCEGCLDRYGCDMCCPPTFMDFHSGADDTDYHYEKFGRPALPNEY